MIFALSALASPLEGRASLVDGRLELRNDSAFSWTSVVAAVEGTVLCDVGELAPRQAKEIDLAGCVGALPPSPTWVEVTTRQGSLVLQLQPDPGRKIRFEASVLGFPFPRLRIQNLDSVALSGCTLSLNASWRYAIPTLDPQEIDSYALLHFRDGHGSPWPGGDVRSLRLSCEQGASTYIFE